MVWTIVGILAAALVSTSFLHQIYKGIRTKQLADVSGPMLAMITAGMFLWFLYGYHLGDIVIMGANIFGTACVATILALKYKYARVA